MSRNLALRLERLESRIGWRREPFRAAIRFVESTGEVTETLFLEEGRDDRWLPGDAPLPEDWPQMRAD